jgi:hypothetical protein
VSAAGDRAGWKRAGLALAMVIGGVAVGSLLTIPVLVVSGAIVSIPGVHRVLNEVLNKDFDGPLIWVLLVSSWMLGIISVYALVSLVLSSRDADNGVD